MSSIDEHLVEDSGEYILSDIIQGRSNFEAVRRDREAGNFKKGEWMLYHAGERIKTSDSLKDLLGEDKKIRRIKGKISTLISRIME